MTTTTMHFGPEWMRTKVPSRPAPSPPLATSPTPLTAASYSALVAPVVNSAPEGRDVVRPFKYSKEEMLRIYKEGGGRSGLGLEVEIWDGIVREDGSDPVGLKEPSEVEKKILAGSLNSEIRRRQSTDYISPLTTSSLGDRPKLGHPASGGVSPMRERIGNLAGKRRDSSDHASLTVSRKLSLSSPTAPLVSPRDGALPSPRTRLGSGFDGVLSDSWTARRRASEAKTRAEREGPEGKHDAKGPDIQEGQEGKDGLNPLQIGNPRPSPEAPLNIPSGSPSVVTDSKVPDGTSIIEGTNSSISNLSLGNLQPNTPSGVGTSTPVVTNPAGPTDLAAIEWSYLDPQGEMQGPFRADTMQRWYDDGYFASNLRMKRTQLDTEWTAVGELARRVGNNQVFLSPVVHSLAPPGLPRRLDPLLEGSEVVQRGFNSPFQPAPTRSLRTSTLDPYLQNGSSASNSPSSSFGAHRFTNGSPDPVAYGGRIGNHLYAEPAAMFRAAEFGSTPESPSLSEIPRRAIFNQSFDANLNSRPSFGNTTPGRAVPDGLGFGLDGATISPESPVGPFVPNLGNGPDTASSSVPFARGSPFGVIRGGVQNGISSSNYSATLGSSNFGSIGTYNGPSSSSRVMNRDVFMERPDVTGGNNNAAYMNGTTPFAPNGPLYEQPLSLQQVPPQDALSLQSLSSVAERQSVVPSFSSPQPRNTQHSLGPSTNYPSPQSSWLSQDPSSLRRVGPFESTHPTVENTTLIPPQPTFHGRTQNNGVSQERSAWFTASHGGVNGSWGIGTNSLTVANLGQHNQQQQQGSESPVPKSPAQPEVAAPATPNTPPQPSASAATAQPSTPDASHPVQKPRRKPSVPLAQTQPVSNKPITTVPPASEHPLTPVVVTEARPAWGAEEDGKKVRSPSTGVNLRDIQEAEAKKLEARKAAERGRAKAARATAALQTEELQSFTASWGLPTSQVGAARSNVTTERESSGSTTAPSPPVWTNAVKPSTAKKTMKEIQEEEERRKLTVKEKETVIVAGRRAYAETTNKVSTAAPIANSAWTTVGSSGKSPATTPAISRPVVASSVTGKVAGSPSSPSLATSRPAASVTPTPRAGATPVARSPSAKADEIPASPSSDFLKWLSDSLKGLNSSVNFEEITSMLLSFPLDPDPATGEIISEMIYANSTTLDGRRFANEFIAKRKADAASRPKGATPTGTPGRPMSIADVVKTQPKPTQSEWGFKVVNKKKKGGRA